MDEQPEPARAGAPARTADPKASAREAARIVGDVVGSRLQRHTGDEAWTGCAWSGIGPALELKPLRPYLYEGLAGLALFFGALAAVVDERRFSHVADDATRRLRAGVEAPAAGRLPLGTEGLGGIALAGAALYELSEHEDARAITSRAAAWLVHRASPEHGLSGTDLIGGEAGAIAALVALVDAELVDDGQVRPAIEHYAELLLRAQRTSGPHLGAWPLFDEGFHFVGLGHGTSGIAWALHRAKSVLDHRCGELDDAIERALRYEDATIDDTIGNWVDPRFPDEPGQMNAWCYGATGVRLVRSALGRAAPAGCIEPWECDVQPVDHLCCGVAGRLEAAVAGSVASPDPNVERMVDDLVRRIGDGTARVEHVDDLATSTGLFRGLPGVGYALLRYGSDAPLPSVLLLSW